MTIRTKIICTIGPAVNNYESICALIYAGMNVARLNFSHGTHQDHLRVIEILKQARKDLGVPLGIMLDTKGPEIRLGMIKNNEAILTHGQEWILYAGDFEGDNYCATIHPSNILQQLNPGQTVLFDDGYISTTVLRREGEHVTLRVDNGGRIRSQKGVNIPNISLNLPAVTERDIGDLQFGAANGIDIVAASFVRSADHVLQVKKILTDAGRPDVLIIAKIENNEGVENFDSIVQVADGIMIARGDLGVEVPLSHVPKLQKMMIRKSIVAGKISITATQMLESMINNPRPTRAEVSDVANAIYDSTSAVMLSGETAMGKYPVQAVKIMSSIVKETENDLNYQDQFTIHTQQVYHDVASSVTIATVKTAWYSQAKAIFAFTRSGATARLLARLRPVQPILAFVNDETTYHQLSLAWGVIPAYDPHEYQSLEEGFERASEFAITHNIAAFGDLVVATAGSPFGIAGTTNAMVVESLGDVLVRGQGGSGKVVHGKVTFILSPTSKRPYAVKDHVIVLTKCDDSYLPLIKEAKGIILHNHHDDVESEKCLQGIADEFDKSILLRADGASAILKEGSLVTLDPQKALVYKGVILQR